MSEIVKKLDSWTLIKIVDKSKLRHKPVCARCGKEAVNGELFWKHVKHQRRFKGTGYVVDYRCLKCFKRMWM